MDLARDLIAKTTIAPAAGSFRAETLIVWKFIRRPRRCPRHAVPAIRLVRCRRGGIKHSTNARRRRERHARGMPRSRDSSRLDRRGIRPVSDGHALCRHVSLINVGKYCRL